MNLLELSPPVYVPVIDSLYIYIYIYIYIYTSVYLPVPRFVMMLRRGRGGPTVSTIMTLILKTSLEVFPNYSAKTLKLPFVNNQLRDS